MRNILRRSYKGHPRIKGLGFRVSGFGFRVTLNPKP